MFPLCLPLTWAIALAFAQGSAPFLSAQRIFSNLSVVGQSAHRQYSVTQEFGGGSRRQQNRETVLWGTGQWKHRF
jgi:hypothetical protein